MKIFEGINILLFIIYLILRKTVITNSNSLIFSVIFLTIIISISILKIKARKK
ncbi:MAG: hypothetical protein ACLR2K_10500 [Paraclostridium sordellii]